MELQGFKIHDSKSFVKLMDLAEWVNSEKESNKHIIYMNDEDLLSARTLLKNLGDNGMSAVRLSVNGCDPVETEVDHLRYGNHEIVLVPESARK